MAQDTDAPTSRLVLTNYQSPGDILMLTAAVRDLHAAYPGKFTTDLRTSCGQLWDNSPNVTRFPEPWIEDEAAQARESTRVIVRDGVTIIPASYPLVQHSNQNPVHFVTSFHAHLESILDMDIPVTRPHGDIHISNDERSWMSQVQEAGIHEPFWIMVTGGKWDATAKWPNPNTLQDVVDHFRGKMLFVQVGANGDWQPELAGTMNVVGQTDLRMLVRLVYHAAGVVTPVTSLMHLAAAVPTGADRPKVRPCVVIAGGREPTHWEAYPTHRYLSTQGALPCCAPDACWKSRSTPVGDGDDKDKALCEHYTECPAGLSFHSTRKYETLRIPNCINMIGATDIIRAIDSYSGLTSAA